MQLLIVKILNFKLIAMMISSDKNYPLLGRMLELVVRFALPCQASVDKFKLHMDIIHQCNNLLNKVLNSISDLFCTEKKSEPPI